MKNHQEKISIVVFSSRLLRSILFSTGFIITIALFGMLIIFSCPFSQIVSRALLVSWAKCNIWTLKVFCDLSFEVRGKEKIPDYPVVVMPKHQSTWETIFLQTIFPSHVWVLKKEIIKIPIFGWTLKAMGSIAIDRSDIRKALKQVVINGTKQLEKGKNIIIFPEGTRISPGKKGDYNIGGAFLAKKTKTPVLPIAHNAGDFWSRKEFVKKPGVITVVIGDQIDSTNHSVSEIMQLTEDWIETTMQDISLCYSDNGIESGA